MSGIGVFWPIRYTTWPPTVTLAVERTDWLAIGGDINLEMFGETLVGKVWSYSVRPRYPSEYSVPYGYSVVEIDLAVNGDLELKAWQRDRRERLGRHVAVLRDGTTDEDAR